MRPTAATNEILRYLDDLHVNGYRHIEGAGGLLQVLYPDDVTSKAIGKEVVDYWLTLQDDRVQESWMLTNVTPPAITGTMTVGSEISVDDGTFTTGSAGSPAILGYRYQWLRVADATGGSAVTLAATASDYTLVTADLNKRIRAIVTAYYGLAEDKELVAFTTVTATIGAGA